MSTRRSKKGSKSPHAKPEDGATGDALSSLTPRANTSTQFPVPVFAGDESQLTSSTSNDDDNEFQAFVRKTLINIHQGQADINKQISQQGDQHQWLHPVRKQTDHRPWKQELESLRQHTATIDQQLAEHNDMLNKLERFSRRTNIMIIGLPQNKDEDCLALASRFIQDKFGMANVKLERAHRDGPKLPGKSQHLLIKLNCYQDKINILRQQRQLLSTEAYFCVEDLTKQDLGEKRRWKSEVSKAYQEISGTASLPEDGVAMEGSRSTSIVRRNPATSPIAYYI